MLLLLLLGGSMTIIMSIVMMPLCSPPSRRRVVHRCRVVDVDDRWSPDAAARCNNAVRGHRRSHVDPSHVGLCMLVNHNVIVILIVTIRQYDTVYRGRLLDFTYVQWLPGTDVADHHGALR
jgi:hypothetical protein